MIKILFKEAPTPSESTYILAIPALSKNLKAGEKIETVEMILVPKITNNSKRVVNFEETPSFCSYTLTKDAHIGSTRIWVK